MEEGWEDKLEALLPWKDREIHSGDTCGRFLSRGSRRSRSPRMTLDGRLFSSDFKIFFRKPYCPQTAGLPAVGYKEISPAM